MNRKIKSLILSSTLLMATINLGFTQTFDGFGKDIPLSNAVKQIVPDSWTVKYDDGVDTSKNISWNAAQDWQTALKNATNKSGLEVKFENNIVEISKITETKSYANVPVEKEEKMPPKKNENKKYSQPKKPEKSTVVQQNNESENKEIGGGGFVITPYKTNVNNQNTAKTETTKTENGFKPYSGKVSKDTENKTDMYSVKAGETLNRVLKDWTNKAGWKLVWNIEYNYPIKADAAFGNDFVEAIQNLINSLKNARPQPTVEIFKGNKVIVISNDATDNVN